MIRQAAFVLCSVIGAAQVPQQDPFDAASQAYFQARQKGQFDVATVQRERMNQLLQALAPDEPQFAGRAQSLAQFYENDGMSATGRAVLEGALARTEAANAPGQARASLSLTLASFWERDRNLLKSLASLEKAAAILEQTPASHDPAQPRGRPAGRWFMPGNASQGLMVRPGVISAAGPFRGGAIYGLSPTISRVSVYTQLADLYQRLGRRDQAAAVLAKMKALPAPSNNWNLAQYYEQHGDLKDAAAIFQKQMEDSASDPGQMIFPAESLARIYERMQRPNDAAAVLRQAIAAIDASGNPELGAQSDLHPQLAMLLYRSGRAEAADQAFPPPVDTGSPAPWPAISYANYLGATNRAAQAEKFLSDYLAEHPGLSVGEQSSLLLTLASSARVAGDSKRAEEYQLESEQKRPPRDPPADVVLINPILQKAQSEASMGNTAQASVLATQAIAQSRNAQDREALRMATGVASIIGNKAAQQADELFLSVIEVTQSWSGETMAPWLTALGDYPQFLMSLQRSGDAVPAIERYRSALKTARGADTGWMEEPLKMTVDLERIRNSPQAAILAAESLLGLEETLDGPASEPLYSAAETLAQLYRSSGDSARALPLYQQMIVIGDAVFQANDPRRVQSRTNAATLLIAERRFDEAEPLVLESMQLRKTAPAEGRDQLTQLLDQIHALKQLQ